MMGFAQRGGWGLRLLFLHGRGAEDFDGFTHVFDGDVAGDEGLAGAGEEDEFDGAVEEFFVLGDFVHDGVGFQAFGEGGGEVHGEDDVHDGAGVFGGEPGFFDAEVEGGADAEGDGFTVEDFSVGEGGFDAVADGVAEVEKGADVLGFPFVFFDDARFDGDVACDEVGEFFDGGEGESDGDFGADVAEFGQHGGVADGCVFDDFCHAFREGPGGHGDEGGGVDDDEGGLVEGADEVFAFGDVDGGFSSGGAVGLGDDGRRDLHEGYAAIVDGGDESGEVSDDASAEGGDGAGAVVSGADEFGAKLLGAGEVFAGFSGGDDVEAGCVTGVFEGDFDAFCVEASNAGLGDDGDFTGDAGAVGEFADAVKVAVVDVDVVGAFSQG